MRRRAFRSSRFNGAYPRRDRKHANGRVMMSDPCNASMEPIPGGIGNEDSVTVASHGRSASMEPIPGGIGNLRTMASLGRSGWLQWSLSPEG